MSEAENKDETRVWNKETLVFYLSIYYSGEVNWSAQLERLKVQKKSNAALVQKQVAYTILSPYLHHTRPTTPVEALLFVCPKFSDFNDMEWAEELEKVYEEDKALKALREELLALGSIHPVEYHVRSRQGLKWLCEQASEDPTIQVNDKDEVVNRLKNLILIYGPSAVCSLFQRPEMKAQFLPKVHNWRSGYFVEKELHRLFSRKELLEMKSHDIDTAPKELKKFFVKQSSS